MGFLAVANSLVLCVPSRAQTPAVPQSCRSTSTANENSRKNTDEKVENPDGKAVATREVIVERIEFDQTVHLSDSDVQQVIKTANEAKYDAESPAWVDELAETGLRSAWQDQGYFKVAIDPQARPLGSDTSHERFLVAVHVLQEGPQFHLGDVKFTGGTTFSEAELRQVIPLREGEFFDVERVRKSLEVLTKLYGSHGYIDFTAEPETLVDENLQRISLVLNLNEQTQYHVGSVEIRGLSPALDASLRSIVVPGEVFNFEAIETFFKANRAFLPSRGIDNFQIRRNAKTGIVDLTFDPQFCP